ncbi:MAG: hypothetical protein GC162_12030 [Planctomycetes bacterium]|nr:hypothetical protein [Planctomycetota bacterium]
MVREMKRRVDAWLNGGGEKYGPLRVVYLSCSDQEPFEGCVERIDRVLTEIQNWYAVQCESLGLGRMTFGLERDAQGRAALLLGRLPVTVGSRTRENRGQTTEACRAAARGVLAAKGVDYDHSFVLIITQIPDDEGAAPFFGNIMQDRGYCFAVDAPWFDVDYTTTTGPRVWKGKPVGPANSALIGGMAHEIGHGFGMYHSDERPEIARFGESLMASGNYTFRGALRGEKRDSFLLDTDAMYLLSRPVFEGRAREFDRRPKATLHEVKLTAEADGRVRMTGRIESDVPVYGVKLYDDPPGNPQDYDALAHAALPDESTGTFEITFKAVNEKGKHTLRLMLMHVNGRWTELRSAMTIGEDGKIDLGEVNGAWGR